jgi:hypothetical protein
MGKTSPRSDRAKDPHRPGVAAAKERIKRASRPLYLDPSGLRQLISDIAGDAVDPSLLRLTDPDATDAERRAMARMLLLRNLHDDLDQEGRRFRLYEAVDAYVPSAADIEAMSAAEFHLGKTIEALRLTATDVEARAAARRRFLMLLQHAQGVDLVDDELRALQNLHGRVNDCRRRPIGRPGRRGEEAKTWLVGELPRIFAKHFGFLEASLKPGEFAKRRNLFVVRVAAMYGVPMSRAAIKKRRRRAEPS